MKNYKAVFFHFYSHFKLNEVQILNYNVCKEFVLNILNITTSPSKLTNHLQIPFHINMMTIFISCLMKTNQMSVIEFYIIKNK